MEQSSTNTCAASTTPSAMGTTKKMKIVFVGDGGTGKTAYIQRYLRNFIPDYRATVGCNVSSLTWDTNHGEIETTIWDTAGQERLAGLRDEYYKEADAFVVFFDTTNTSTFLTVPDWIEDIRRISQSPIVVVGNKVDSRDRKVKLKTIGEFIHQHSQIDAYFDISVKSMYNFSQPLLHLFSKHFGKNHKLVEPSMIGCDSSPD